MLERNGFEVRVLDLISMEKSHCYNPFVYLQNDNDVQKLVTNLFKSTTPKGSQSQDPFWDTSASMLLLALVFYLHYEAPEEEQNFAMVMEMLRAGSIEDEEDTRPSPLDELFAELEMTNPDHIALKYYRSYHSGSAKTLKSIQITLAARLEKFNLESLASLTSADELDLLGKETIDTNTYGKSSGRSGNYSTNYQISGRELLTPDEVRMLDNRYAILFIRGERPVMDLKYDILKHPNVAYTTDGREKPYMHGEVTIPHSSISVLAIDPEDVPEGSYGETNYELLSDEDFEVDTNF